MEELEKRFGAKLRLSEKKRVGIRTDESESIDLLKGLQLTLVARVVTHKDVSRENFVGVFTRPRRDTMVARKTGSLMGRVVEVDQAKGEECMSRFLRVRIQMPIDQPLMRGTFVEFSDEGSIWVQFRYEFIPKYCFIYGYLGHSSIVCDRTRTKFHFGICAESCACPTPGRCRALLTKIPF
ncbi:hypothetical protein L3X38_032762 [Prunus dulcis]|uniref:Zinc knuckle CX2CX4HX4C domain-containing protein n=1 Tax=Prunus dulcis TaxID=3755 RepID=A0AAD4VEQ4_PRUDU|nr:hypothetical protein L3X38_032762 [Prunus dulcis]